MNDLQAVEHIKRGDLSGLTVLVERYQTQAVRAAYIITQDRALAEDVCQTVFIQMERSVQSFDTRRPFAPWFFKIVTNAALRVVRKEHRTLSLDEVLSEGDTFADLLPDLAALPADQLETEEVNRSVKEALAQLTPEKRAVIVMRYYLELSAQEISETLDCPPATVRWRIHSGLQQLRRLLVGAIEK